jgi:hypothetical protein
VAGCGDRLGIEAVLRDHLIVDRQVPCCDRAREGERRPCRSLLRLRPSLARRLPCDARRSGQVRKLGPEYGASDSADLALTGQPRPAALLGAPQVAPVTARTRLRRAASVFRRADWSVRPAHRGTRRAAQTDEGLRLALRRGVERNCLRSERRQTPQGVCRPCEAEFFARLRSASSAEQSLRSSDRGGRGGGRIGQAAHAQS